MFAITVLSEHVNDRSLVSMAQDLWGLPFLIAIYLLPKNPNPWVYYVSILDSRRTLGDLLMLTLPATGPGYGSTVIPLHTSDSSRVVLAQLWCCCEPNS